MKIFVSKRLRTLQNLTGREDGSAIVIALLVMVLLMGFVVLAISPDEQRNYLRGE
ncbi:MAG: hypothetical protein IPM21_17405 [Acidobacteria bacterium]|nr:hypothetical protein [Acidobacteriota bacterium]